MEKKMSNSGRKAEPTESQTRTTLSQSTVDHESHHSPLHSPSDAKSSPSPVHTPSPSPENPLSKAIVPVDYTYPVKASPPPPSHAPSSPPPLPSNAVRKPRIRRSRRWSGGVGWLDRAALGFRAAEMLLCLVSFSVMAADRTEGWSGDSFDRYKEYRYCLSVTVIAFVYAGLQVCTMSYFLITGKNLIKNQLLHRFEFTVDQILAYLLISASSSAATRVDDWQSNWGERRVHHHGNCFCHNVVSSICYLCSQLLNLRIQSLWRPLFMKQPILFVGTSILTNFLWLLLYWLAGSARNPWMMAHLT